MSTEDQSNVTTVEETPETDDTASAEAAEQQAIEAAQSAYQDAASKVFDNDFETPVKEDDAGVADVPDEPAEPAKGEPQGQEGGEGDPDASSPKPSNLVTRSAEQAGFSQEELNHLREANPELADKVFTKLSDELVTESLRLARAGSAGEQGQPSSQPTQTQGQPAGEQSVGKLDTVISSLSDENLQAFEDAQGPEFVQQFLKPLRDALGELKEQVIEPVTELKTQMTAREQETLHQTVDQAFDGLGDKEFYGQGSSPTNEQLQNRERVAQLADQIRAGAWAQGQDLPIPDAIERAHLIVSNGRQAEQARQELVGKVKKQSKGRVSRPNSASDPNPGTEEAALAAYRQRVAELGIQDQD